MLEEFMGLPAHPLLVHAAVVFVPLLAILAVTYAFVPFVRPHARWTLAVLALLAPVSALLATLSGEAFFDRLDSRGGISEEYYPKLETHEGYGELTLYVAIAQALLAAALVYFVRPRSTATHSAGAAGPNRLLSLVLGALSLVAAGASLYFVFRTGDSGASAVWDGQ